MELLHLYSMAEKENIDVTDYTFKNENINGVFIENGKIIAINKSLTDTQRKCVFAEELGHYYCNATYPPSCKDEILINRSEYRAKKWSVKALIPYSSLQKVKDIGLQYKWEIAEELGVTEDLVERAAQLYCAH